jgi:hypothetical protein
MSQLAVSATLVRGKPKLVAVGLVMVGLASGREPPSILQ